MQPPDTTAAAPSPMHNNTQSKTMPAVPAHHLGWRGTPLQLEVQQPSTNRLRVTSHSNEYVGLLRERIARQLGCGANQVRIVLLGKSCSNMFQGARRLLIMGQ